jgi:Acetyltransferase (GNAT) family
VRIRRLAATDTAKAVPLLADLGYPTTPAEFAERLAAVGANSSDEILVAEEDGNILGLVAVHSFEMLHRPGRLGRVTALVVAASARRRGVGTASNGYTSSRTLRPIKTLERKREQQTAKPRPLHPLRNGRLLDIA